jgi:hypothetical protein
VTWGLSLKWRVGSDFLPYRGTSLIRKRPCLRDDLRTLSIGFLRGPRGRRFLMSEVLLQDIRKSPGLLWAQF